MAINITPRQLTIAHLEFLAEFQDKNHMYHTLSSTKHRLANDLHDRKLIEDNINDDGKTVLKMTQNGRNLLNHLVLISNQ